jgi:hypothetical protein
MFFIGLQRPNSSNQRSYTNILSLIYKVLMGNTIPSLDAVQMSALLHRVFTIADRMLRFEIAEVVYRYNHDHPNALDLPPACRTLLPAERPLISGVASCRRRGKHDETHQEEEIGFARLPLRSSGDSQGFEFGRISC